MRDRGTNGPFRLPVPGKQAREHSLGLTALIRERISQNGGDIGFDDFMEMALYEPDWGYYSAGAAKFDALGDFTTAPHVSSLFSRCLARQCAQVLASLPAGDILEIGAGSGVMAKDLLQELEAIEALPANYLILERSPALRLRQQRLFATHIPQLLPRARWLSALPETPFQGVMLANELVDAMPVKRYVLRHGEAQELRIGHRDGEFHWGEGPPEPAMAEWFEDIMKRRQAENAGGAYLTERNTQAESWIKLAAAVLERGALLLIDYGYPRHEYYHPQRDRGALLCHYRHRCHDDPFFYPGLQDITASVDFTALARAAGDSGLQVAGYAAQAHFLISCGLMELASASRHGDGGFDPAVSQQVKLLTLPGEMGERFKAIAFAKDYAGDLLGFQFIDQRDHLWRH